MKKLLFVIIIGALISNAYSQTESKNQDRLRFVAPSMLASSITKGLTMDYLSKTDIKPKWVHTISDASGLLVGGIVGNYECSKYSNYDNTNKVISGTSVIAGVLVVKYLLRNHITVKRNIENKKGYVF